MIAPVGMSMPTYSATKDQGRPVAEAPPVEPTTDSARATDLPAPPKPPAPSSDPGIVLDSTTHQVVPVVRDAQTHAVVEELPPEALRHAGRPPGSATTALGDILDIRL